MPESINPFEAAYHKTDPKDVEDFKQQCISNITDSCPCSGVKSTSSHYPNDHPACIKTISTGGTGDKTECLLAAMCLKKFPELENHYPKCGLNDDCPYPCYVEDELYQKCDKWDTECINNFMTKSDVCNQTKQ